MFVTGLHPTNSNTVAENELRILNLKTRTRSESAHIRQVNFFNGGQGAKRSYVQIETFNFTFAQHLLCISNVQFIHIRLI